MSLPDFSTLKDRFSQTNIQRTELGRLVNSAVGRNILDLSFVNARSEIGVLQLDALLTESFSGSSTVTAYPTESGFPVADNVARDNDTLHIEGVVTGIFPLTLQYSNLYAVGSARLAKARDMLKEQHDSGLPLTVLTGLNLYQGFVITAYSVERNADDGEQINISVDLVHIRKATATETAVPEAYAKKADDMSNRGTEGGGTTKGVAASEKAGGTRTNAGKAATGTVTPIRQSTLSERLGGIGYQIKEP